MAAANGAHRGRRGAAPADSRRNRGRMDLRQLRYFAAVAETCHFGQASERLRVSQSTISQTIRALEDELGVILLERTTRQVAPTPAGEFLQSEADQIFERVEEAEAGVRRLSAGRSGVLRVAMTGIATYAYLPRIAQLLREHLSGVVLSVQGDMLTPDQCDALRSGSLELGILRPPVVGPDIATVPFVTEGLLLAMPEGHPLVSKPDLSLADLRDEPWVAYSGTHSPINDAVTRACLDAGFMPRREHVGQTTSVLIGLVSAGMGVALVTEGIRALPRRGVVFREVPGVGEVEEVLAFRASTRNPVVSAAVSLLSARDGWAIPS